MAFPIRDDLLGRHDRYAPVNRGEEIDRAVKLVNRLMAERPAPGENIPWHDSVFQEAVLRTLQQCRQYKKDSEDLAVIQRVFGGK